MYINGTPYLRRELEMPAAALHHAGIQAAQLEEQEAFLAEDVWQEAHNWGGKIMVHQEIREASGVVSGSGNGQPPSTPIKRADSIGAPLLPPETPPPMMRTNSLERAKEDVTRVVDKQPGLSVTPVWETNVEVGDQQPAQQQAACDGVNAGSFSESIESPRQALVPPPPTVVATPKAIFALLAEEGYSLTYSRIPLSRERTPEASDLEALHEQVSGPGVNSTCFVMCDNELPIIFGR